MKRTVRGIACDFGNVNGDFDHAIAITALSVWSPLNVDEIRSRIFASSLEDDYDCGRITTREFLVALRQALAIPACVEDTRLAAAWRDIFCRSANNEHVIATLNRVPPGTRVVLASNTNELHFEAIAEGWADLLDRLDDLVLSFRVGARKPARQFYEAVLKQLGTEPSESLFIDDRADFITAARDCGMQAVHYVAGMDLAAALTELGLVLSR